MESSIITRKGVYSLFKSVLIDLDYIASEDENIPDFLKDIIPLLEEITRISQQEFITSSHILIDIQGNGVETPFYVSAIQEIEILPKILEEYFKLLDAIYIKRTSNLNLIYDFKFRSKIKDKLESSLPDIREILYFDYLNNSGLDFIIKTENKEFKVHKLILRCLNSPYFEKLLSNSMIENLNSQLKLEDDSEIVNYFIEFIYLGKEKFSSKYQENLPYMELFVLAKRLQVEALSNYILEQLNLNVTISELENLIEYSNVYKDDLYLEKIVSSFDGQTIEDFLKSPNNHVIRKYYNPQTDNIIVRDNLFVIKTPSKLYLGTVSLLNNQSYDSNSDINIWRIKINEDKEYPGIIEYYLNYYQFYRYDYYIEPPKERLAFTIKESHEEDVYSSLEKKYEGCKIQEEHEHRSLEIEFVSLFGILVLEEVNQDYAIYYSPKYPEIKFYKGETNLILVSSAINLYPHPQKFFKKYHITNVRYYDKFIKIKEKYDQIKKKLYHFDRHELIVFKDFELYSRLILDCQSRNKQSRINIIFPKDESKPFIGWKRYYDIIIGRYFLSNMMEYYPERGEPYSKMTKITQEEYTLMCKFNLIYDVIKRKEKIKIISLDHQLIKVGASDYHYYKYLHNSDVYIYHYSIYEFELEPEIVKRILLIKSGKNPDKDELDIYNQEKYNDYVVEYESKVSEDEEEEEED